MNKYPTKESIDSLIKKLDLPKLNSYSQDWEYEVSDSNRAEELINYYINNSLNDDEKFTLMIVIIGSCNDALEEKKLKSDTWEKVKNALIKDKDLHDSTIDYWSCDNEEVVNSFEITPLIRAVKIQLR